MSYRTIKVRTYEFQHGLLHLKKSVAESLTMKEVIAQFGEGKGDLVDMWDDSLYLTYFNSLGEFTEQ